MVGIVTGPDERGLQDVGDNFIAGMQLRRQRKRDEADDADSAWRKKQIEQESLRRDQRDTESDRRSDRQFDQTERFHQDEETWRTKRAQLDAQARASAAQEHASEWRSIFNEDPPAELFDFEGNMLAPHLDPSSDIPIEVQQLIHEHAQNPSSSPADTMALKQTMKQVALERAKGAVRRKIERWAQPDAEEGSGAGAAQMRPEQILPGSQAKEWIKGLDDIKDVNDPKAFENIDDINDKLEAFSKDHTQQTTDRNARDAVVQRLNGALDKVSQRDLEDGAGSSIPQARLDELSGLMEGIAKSNLGGNALEAAEERWHTKMREARTGGGTGSRADTLPFNRQHPSNQAVTVFKALAPDQRTPENFFKLEQLFAQQAIDEQQKAEEQAQMAEGRKRAIQSLPYETGSGADRTSPDPAGSGALPAGASEIAPEKADRLSRLKQLREGGLGLDGKPGKISLEDGVAFVDGNAEPTDDDLKAERARLSQGYVSDRERGKIAEIDKRLPERQKERAAKKVEADIDEQFVSSAIERMPSTEKQWIDDMQRVEDLSKGNSGYATKAKRLYLKLKELGESKGWNRGTD